MKAIKAIKRRINRARKDARKRKATVEDLCYEVRALRVIIARMLEEQRHVAFYLRDYKPSASLDAAQDIANGKPGVINKIRRVFSTDVLEPPCDTD